LPTKISLVRPVTALTAAAHDIVWVRAAAPGISDPDVLAWAARDERILLTFDKDFGELARSSALPSRCGVVLFRMPMPGLVMSASDLAC
jgi:predicted nuclease of predicted toxin-antitoxin system